MNTTFCLFFYSSSFDLNITYLQNGVQKVVSDCLKGFSCVEMFADDVDECNMTESRATWKAEIDEWLERLKATEKDLGLKEKELRQREVLLRQREKQLEEQFHVVVSVLCCSSVVLYAVILFV